MQKQIEKKLSTQVQKSKRQYFTNIEQKAAIIQLKDMKVYIWLMPFNKNGLIEFEMIALIQRGQKIQSWRRQIIFSKHYGRKWQSVDQININFKVHPLIPELMLLNIEYQTHNFLFKIFSIFFFQAQAPQQQIYLDNISLHRLKPIDIQWIPVEYPTLAIIVEDKLLFANINAEGSVEAKKSILLKSQLKINTQVNFISVLSFEAKNILVLASKSNNNFVYQIKINQNGELQNLYLINSFQCSNKKHETTQFMFCWKAQIKKNGRPEQQNILIAKIKRKTLIGLSREGYILQCGIFNCKNSYYQTIFIFQGKLPQKDQEKGQKISMIGHCEYYSLMFWHCNVLAMIDLRQWLRNVQTNIREQKTRNNLQFNQKILKPIVKINKKTIQFVTYENGYVIINQNINNKIKWNKLSLNNYFIQAKMQTTIQALQQQMSTFQKQLSKSYQIKNDVIKKFNKQINIKSNMEDSQVKKIQKQIDQFTSLTKRDFENSKRVMIQLLNEATNKQKQFNQKRKRWDKLRLLLDQVSQNSKKIDNLTKGNKNNPEQILNKFVGEVKAIKIDIDKKAREDFQSDLTICKSDLSQLIQKINQIQNYVKKLK